MNVKSLMQVSPQGLRQVAVALVKTAHGGSIVDPVYIFLQVLKDKAGGTMEAPTREFFNEEVEKQIAALKGMLAKAREEHRSLFEFAAKKLGRRFFPKAQQAKIPPKRLTDWDPKDKSTRTQSLMTTLKKTKDQDEKRRLRRKLRRLGHSGGEGVRDSKKGVSKKTKK